MTSASIILPMTAATPFMEYVNNVALRTLHASTDANVLVLGNNTPSRQSIERLAALCDLLHMDFKFIEGPFSQSRFWNMGIDLTTSQNTRYLVFANADCIFFPSWLSNLIELWEESDAANPGHPYYALWPWSLSTRDMGLAYRVSTIPERRIIETHHPAIALVMRRASAYRWDEQFSLWEMDADFMEYCNRDGHRTGLCMASRVDHFNSTVSSNIDLDAHMDGGMSDHHGSTARLRAKWGLS